MEGEMIDDDGIKVGNLMEPEELLGDRIKLQGLEILFYEDPQDAHDETEHVGFGVIYSGEESSFAWAEGIDKVIPSPEFAKGAPLRPERPGERNDSWKNLVEQTDLDRFEEDVMRLRSGEKDAIQIKLRTRMDEIHARVNFCFFVLGRNPDGAPKAAAGWYQHMSEEWWFEQELIDIATNIYAASECLVHEGVGLPSSVHPCADYLGDSSVREADALWLSALVWAGQAVLENEQRLLHFVKDRSLRYVYVGSGLAALFGMKPSEMIGKTDSDLFGEPGTATEAEIRNTLLSGGRVRIHDHGSSGISPKFGALSMRAVALSDYTQAQWVLGVVTTADQALRQPEAEQRKTAMQEVMEQAVKVARHDSIVLLYGETGSGKTRMAEIIHKHSSRATGPFEMINCAAIPPTLAESQLFGHEKGAFTGATNKEEGILKQADGGTLFLDEIGKMSLDIQAKLLTFLDGKGFKRVGGTEMVTPSVRIVAATNIDLEELVSKGLFLEDLYYRLNVVPIRIPSLRDRHEELPDIVDSVVSDLCSRLNLARQHVIGKKEIDAIKGYPWRGNIRELRNILERAFVLGMKVDQILPATGRQKKETRSEKTRQGVRADTHDGVAEEWTWKTEFSPGRTYTELLTDFKRALFEEAIKRSGGNKAQAAKLIGTARETFTRRLKELGIEVEKPSRVH
jgi:DNA-binding NtrC family response regulator